MGRGLAPQSSIGNRRVHRKRWKVLSLLGEAGRAVLTGPKKCILLFLAFGRLMNISKTSFLLFPVEWPFSFFYVTYL